MPSTSFLRSTIGQKVIVAVTGAVLFLFVVGHLAGNLQIFGGPDKLNRYGEFLKHAKPLLWGTRVVLLFSVVLHAVFTVKLNLRNRASRPVDYAVYDPVQATVASRFMIWSGVFMALYIPYHLLHLTTGAVHPNFHATDIYANVVAGFSSWPVAALYILAMIALGFHLHHGVYSIFQTLGLNHPRYNLWRRYLAVAAGWLIPLGYILIPVSVLTGFLPPH